MELCRITTLALLYYHHFGEAKVRREGCSIYRYVNKYNLPLTVLLHANCYTPFHGARERVTSGGAVWLVVRVVFVVAINTCITLQKLNNFLRSASLLEQSYAIQYITVSRIHPKTFPTCVT